MEKKLPELSVFFPFWNEEKNVRETVESAVEVLPGVASEWEIIIVDDGSADDTLKIAQELAHKNKNVRVISHKPNRGYGAALKEGFLNAKFKFVVFMDGDRQFDFSQVTRFVEEINGADMVIGYRKKRRDRKLFKRLLLMNLLKLWDFILFGFHFRDIDCGFKMFNRNALSEIMPLRSEGAMITTEILAKAVRKKLKIKQVEVDHFERKHGVQTGANLPVITRAVLEGLTLWLELANKRV